MAPKRRTKERRKHAFYADGDIPADHKGNRRCRRCGVLGQPGDQRHTAEFPETPPEAAEIDARILGEG